MKKRNFIKRIIALGIGVMISISCTGNLVYAVENDTLLCDSDVRKIVTAEEAKIIDDKIAEISALEMQQLQLEAQVKYVAAKSYSRIDEVEEKISYIDDEINMITQDLYDLGAEKPSESMIDKLINNQNENVSNAARYAGQPSDFVTALEDKYNALGYYTTGTDGRQQYHIILRYGSDPEFCQSGAVVFLREYKTGSTLAKQFLNMCVDMIVNKMLEEIPLVSVVPWEYLFESQPGSQVISCPGQDSVFGDYGIVTNMKFVAVYNDSGNWDFVLSTNRILATYTLRAAVMANNNSYVKTETILTATGEEIAGRFHYSSKDATDAFESGEFVNTCMTEWIWRTRVVENGNTIIKNIVELYLPSSSRIVDYIN